jgi:hypothetical protein
VSHRPEHAEEGKTTPLDGKTQKYDNLSATEQDKDQSKNSEDEEPFRARKISLSGHLESLGGAHRGHIRRIVISTSDVSLNGDAHYDSACGQCAKRYISASLLVEGVSLEEIAHTSGTKFLQDFRETLSNEIKKYHSNGLKSIKITSLSTHNGNSLVIEFVAVVNPKQHQQISSAIRRALLSIDLKQTFGHKHNE